MAFNISNITEYDATLLSLLTQNLPDMLWIKDLDGIYIYANKAICDGLLMAKDINEPIGKDDVFFALREREAHKDKPDWHTFGELCFNSDQEVIDNNKPMKFEEYGNIKGKLLYLEVNKAPFYDKDGKIIGTVGSGRDITELKLTQIKLKQQYETIKNQSKMVSMGEMIGNIAHQWRQPLNVLGLKNISLQMHYDNNKIDDQFMKEHIESSSDTLQHMSDTIDDFRDFIKGNREKSNFDLKDSIDSFLNLVEGTIKNNNISIILDLEEDIKINSYENELTQCLINIFNNAKDVLKEKEIENKLVFIFTYIKDTNIIIKIKDNAGGIPNDILPKIFEPYFTTKYKSQGTGLGLHMTYNLIVDEMNGIIEADNVSYKYDDQEHTGAEFIISIPMS